MRLRGRRNFFDWLLFVAIFLQLSSYVCLIDQPVVLLIEVSYKHVELPSLLIVEVELKEVGGAGQLPVRGRPLTAVNLFLSCDVDQIFVHLSSLSYLENWDYF